LVARDGLVVLANDLSGGARGIADRIGRRLLRAKRISARASTDGRAAIDGRNGVSGAAAGDPAVAIASCPAGASTRGVWLRFERADRLVVRLRTTKRRRTVDAPGEWREIASVALDHGVVDAGVLAAGAPWLRT